MLFRFEFLCVIHFSLNLLQLLLRSLVQKTVAKKLFLHNFSHCLKTQYYRPMSYTKLEKNEREREREKREIKILMGHSFTMYPC